MVMIKDYKIYKCGYSLYWVPTSLDIPRFLQFSKKLLISLDKIEKIMNFPRFYFFSLCWTNVYDIYNI